MPKISVISPIYNGRQYILNLIKSLENQTFKDFEFLLINDGSTDDTYNIANEELKKRNIKYKIINKENGGQSSARNLGIKNAKGEWLVFIDSDDTIQKNYLNNLYKASLESKCEIVICDLNRVNESNIFEESNDEYLFEIKKGKEFFVDFINHNIEIGPYSMLINRKYLEKEKTLFDENSKYSEEFIFICSLLHDAKNVIHLKQKLYNYCLRNGSVSTGANIEKIYNGYEEIIKFNIKYKKCNCKYCKIFNEIAMSRWILATARFTSKNLDYEKWLDLLHKLNYKKEIKKLYNYDNTTIKFVSHLLVKFPKLTYQIFRKMRKY